MQKFSDHVKKAIDENYDLHERVRKLELEISNLKNLRASDSDVKLLRQNIEEIGADIKYILRYHDVYNLLVYNLNKILDVRDKIKILDDKTIDNQVLQSLQVIRAIKKFNQINKEIWDCVQKINEEYKTVDCFADEHFARHVMRKHHEGCTYSEAYNMMMSRNNFLQGRLREISKFVQNILFTTGIPFAYEKVFHFLYNDDKCILNFRGALGFINSLCDVNVSNDEHIVIMSHGYSVKNRIGKFSFEI
jgi:hypothetical protein